MGIFARFAALGWARTEDILLNASDMIMFFPSLLVFRWTKWHQACREHRYGVDKAGWLSSWGGANGCNLCIIEWSYDLPYT